MTQESRLVIVIDSRNAERNTRAIADELANLTNKGVQADTQMTAMSSSIKSLVGYMGGLLTINKAIAMADGYTQMAARIRNATQSVEEYTLVQDRLLKTANTTYRQLGEAQEVYLSMAGGMKSLDKSTKDTLDLTDSLSFSFTHNATRVDQAQSAMDSLSKSMAKGKVDGDAWISIVTGADNVIADMAKTTGKTEAEIRKLGAEGKVSLEDLIKTLILTRDENEKLANNMENSLADGFTKLSNEVTVYLGKANEATSATGVMAGSLGVLADNLDMVANTGAALGIGYLTSALLTKGAAVKANMLLSAQQQVADRAELVSQTQLTAAEVRRTASLAQFTTMQLADAKATAARMTGIQRLAYVQSTVIPLEAKATQATAVHTAATMADTVAQEINNKARSRGAMLLGLVGGPIGAITLGVTALAAGYMYMSSRTADANTKLEEQGKIAEKTNEELKKLTGNDKKSAIDDLTAAFTSQNIQLGKSKEAVDAVLFAIRAVSVENEKARKVTEDARRGVISYDEAIKRLNEMDVPTDLYDMLKKQAKEYDVSAAKANTSKVAFKAFGIEVKLAGNEAQNASPKIAGNTKELNANETAAQGAAKAQKDYFDSLNQDVLSANERLAYMNNGFSKEVVDQINKLQEAKQKALGDGVTAIVTTEEINQIVQAQNSLDAIKNKEDEITQAKREQNKEAERSAKLAEKQSVIMAGTNEQTKNMLKVYQAFRNAGVDDTKARVLTAQVGREGDFLNKNLFGSHTDAANRKTNSGMISWQGSRSKSLTQYLQGQGVLDKKGNIEQTQEALNAQAKFFIQEIMTEKRYRSSKNALLGDSSSYRELEKTFGKNAIAWDYNGKNIGSEKASKNLARQDDYYNSLNKVLGGNPENALSSIKDLSKYDDEAYKARKDLLDRIEQLQSQYDTEAISRRKARDEEILQATILSQNDLIPKIKERYEAQDKLAKLQQEFDVEGHKWTEERKLQYTYDTNVLRLTAEGKFSEDQKKIFKKGFKDQYDQELGYIELAKETQLFQAKQAYMHEVDLMQERYRLEMQEIDKIGDAKQRAAMREVTAARLIDDYEKKRKAAEDNLNQTSAQISGFSEYYAIQKEMEDTAAVMGEARKYELISEEEHKAALIEIEKRYMDAKRSLNLSYGEQISSSMANMFKQQGDEQNKFYKATITAEKTFAIMRSMIAIKAGIAQAANNPWPLNLAAMASVAAQTASIVSDIRTIHVEGFATGGKIRGAGTPTSDSIPIYASDKEYMVRAHAAEKLGTPTLDYINRHGELPQNTHRVGMGAVSAINSGKSLGEKATVVQPVINVHTLPGETADVSWKNGELDVRIRKIARETINSDANNPNSGFSKAMKRNFTVDTKR